MRIRGLPGHARHWLWGRSASGRQAAADDRRSERPGPAFSDSWMMPESARRSRAWPTASRCLGLVGMTASPSTMASRWASSLALLTVPSRDHWLRHFGQRAADRLRDLLSVGSQVTGWGGGQGLERWVSPPPVRGSTGGSAPSAWILPSHAAAGQTRSSRGSAQARGAHALYVGLWAAFETGAEKPKLACIGGTSFSSPARPQPGQRDRLFRHVEPEIYVSYCIQNAVRIAIPIIRVGLRKLTQ
jgi:hypothetical protein